jgi:hypothetical protein
MGVSTASIPLLNEAFADQGGVLLMDNCMSQVGAILRSSLVSGAQYNLPTISPRHSPSIQSVSVRALHLLCQPSALSLEEEKIQYARRFQEFCVINIPVEDLLGDGWVLGLIGSRICVHKV